MEINKDRLIKLNKMPVWILSILLVVFLGGGCEEIERGAPVAHDDSPPPPVSDVVVENIPGGATLSYTLPKSDDLLYVLAEYSREQGELSEKKVSYYHNKFTLEGFPDTLARKVTLYTVSRGEQKSAPISVTINPLTSPVDVVANSLEVKKSFGGIVIGFENETEADIKITVITEDSLNNLYIADTHYTGMIDGKYSVRGFEPELRKFGIYVMDRWNNISDTLFVEVTPLFEMQLNKSKFSELHLPGDNWEAYNGQSMSRMWDEDWGQQFASKNGEGFPQSFSFDLGLEAELSRFIFYPRSNNTAWRNVPKYFEVWGSNNPNPDGSWDNWVKLLDGEMVKPSGLPCGQLSDEDIARAIEGIEFEFPPGTPKIRYIRFKTLEVHCEMNVSCAEITFFGAD
jgi:hypothetical protein